MKGLRLTELYPSIQGEGPRTGQVTVFVRFGGCNMRCPGWPCDTQYAIEPSIWKNDPIVEVKEILQRVEDMPGDNICITGGEPTMQPAQHLEDLASGLLDLNYSIDVFTNGSLYALPEWMQCAPVYVIMDWKLVGSGEDKTGVDIRWENAKKLDYKDNIKFVIASQEDYQEATALWRAMQNTVRARFWAGVAWGKFEESQLIHQILEDDLPWSVNVQMHKYIWQGVEKGV